MNNSFRAGAVSTALFVFVCAATDVASQTLTTDAELTGTEEIVSSRSADTRVWENTYLEPVIDPDGNPTGETREVRRRYTELATGLNYDARSWEEIAAGGAPNWQPTVTDWTPSGEPSAPWEVTTGPLKIRLSDNLTSDAHVQIQADAGTLELGVAGLAIQDTSTGETIILETPKLQSR